MKKREHTTISVGIDDLKWFENEGLKIPEESWSNFIYRIRIELNSGRGGFPHSFKMEKNAKPYYNH